jgi:hypothetical protein
LDQGGITILAYFRRVHDPSRCISVRAAATGFSYRFHFVGLLSPYAMVNADSKHQQHDDEDDT